MKTLGSWPIHMVVRSVVAVAVSLLAYGALAARDDATGADRAPPASHRPPRTTAPARARATLLSTPAGATVWINGQRLLWRTPIYDLPVEPGRVRLEFHRWGFEPVVVERDWRPNRSDRVDVTLSPSPARVTFHSDPPGATVSVGGRVLQGTTPLRDVAVAPGRNTVEFRRDGYEPLRIEREWRSRTSDRVRVSLRPRVARVTFVSTPPGASVSLNGRPIPGLTPVENAFVRPGRGTIAFRLEGHASVVVERRWETNEVDRVEAVLAPLPGRVRFTTAKVWTRLEIDGEPARESVDGWWELVPGHHTARAYAGEETGVADFTVEPGAEVTATLAWYRWKPDPERYVLMPTAEVVVGSENYAKENPLRRVVVPAFWVARAEVTVAEYGACVGAGACEAPGTGPQCNWNDAEREQHPINCVTVSDAEAYAAWLRERDGLPYILPSAEQWERAARGAAGERYPWGAQQPGSRCNTCDRSCPFQHFRDEDSDDGWSDTAPVGSLPECRGPEGVFDLVGNVAEWCRDDGAEGEYGVRGGSWGQIGAFLDPAFRSQRQPSDPDPTIGFRLIVPDIGDG